MPAAGGRILKRLPPCGPPASRSGTPAMPPALLRLLLLLLLLLPGPAIVTAAEAIDFERDIRSIFNERCMKCHGPEKSQGGLRLDLRVHAFGTTDSGAPAIVPGKTD